MKARRSLSGGHWAARASRFVLFAAIPLLAAPKCIDYEPLPARDVGPPDTGASDASDDGPAMDAPPLVVPAVPCPTPNNALFSVRNLEYSIVCGCAEAQGRVCTVNPGTTVTWTFADPVEHNVSSLENLFGRSADRLTGQYSHTFHTPGTFGYGCTLHPQVMSGYSVIVAGP